MYEEFKKYIQKVKKRQIKKYKSEKPINPEDRLRGAREKNFVRCSSEIFGELIEELKNNPNCSYETYVNDLVTSGYTPKYISVLKREINPLLASIDKSGLGHLKDTCASRILNFFECPTAYDCMLDIDGELCCCSVDYAKYGEDFYSIVGFMNIYNVGKLGLKRNVDILCEMLDQWKRENEFENFDELKKKFIEDYIYSYLIRVRVLLDSDFGFNNLGLISNPQENTFRMAPNFDFEYCFDYPNCFDFKWRTEVINVFNTRCIEDLSFVQDNYPNIYNKFIDKFNQFNAKKKPVYKSILEKEIGDSKNAKKFTIDYKQYLNVIDNIINTMPILDIKN